MLERMWSLASCVLRPCVYSSTVLVGSSGLGADFPADCLNSFSFHIHLCNLLPADTCVDSDCRTFSVVLFSPHDEACQSNVCISFLTWMSPTVLACSHLHEKYCRTLNVFSSQTCVSLSSVSLSSL